MPHRKAMRRAMLRYCAKIAELNGLDPNDEGFLNVIDVCEKAFAEFDDMTANVMPPSHHSTVTQIMPGVIIAALAITHDELTSAGDQSSFRDSLVELSMLLLELRTALDTTKATGRLN